MKRDNAVMMAIKKGELNPSDKAAITEYRRCISPVKRINVSPPPESDDDEQMEAMKVNYSKFMKVVCYMLFCYTE